MGEEPDDEGIEPIETSPMLAGRSAPDPVPDDDDGVETIETDWETRDVSSWAHAGVCPVSCGDAIWLKPSQRASRSVGD